MKMSPKLRETLRAVAPYIEVIPNGIWFDVEVTGLVFQAATQEDVRRIRAVLPQMVWQKAYSEDCQWWTYTARLGELEFYIYACKEAPPTCRGITETYTAVEKVPVAFENRAVTKERIRWECGEET